MSKGKSRGTGKAIFLLLLAAAIIVGTVLACYCASVNGEWAKNPHPSTWRWGGIWTNQEEPDEGHTHDVHTLSEGLEVEVMAIKEPCPMCNSLSFGTQTVKAATCTEEGIRYKYCKNCNYEYALESIKALGHNYAWTITSTTTESYQCTRCSDEQETRAHTHSYAWVQTIAPTQESEGEEVYKCACGDISDTRTIPELAEPVELPPDPVREGYTFIGWFFDEACKQPYDGRVIYENTALYAGWQINRFTVTFGGAGVDVPAQTVDWNTAAELITPERLGYRFIGWFNGETEYTDETGITADITLTAHWERVQCTVSFYVDGALYTTLTVDYGTPLVQAAEAAGLFAQNLLAYDFVEGGDTDGDIKQVKVTGDMLVTAGEPTTADKIQGAVQSYWLYAACGAAGVVALVLMGAAIVGGKRKRG